jgi:hypothetical protein
MSLWTHRSDLSEPRQGESGVALWKRVAPAIRQIDSLTNKMADLQRQVRTLMRSMGNVISVIHPFKVYQLPTHFRQTSNAAAPNYSDSTDWLKWRVRSGAVTLLSLDNVAPVAQTSAYINVGGCDGVVNPDIETYLDNPLATDILVPAGTAAFYFWVTLTIDPDSGVATAQLYYGTSPAAAAPQADTWPSFPQPDATHQLIAVADSLTQQVNNQVLLRQLARADLLFLETNTVSVCDSSGNSQGNSIAIIGTPQPPSP